MKKSVFYRTITATLIGIVLGASITPAFGQDPIDDNPPGLFEIGLNEDTEEDVDLIIPKGKNSGAVDARANILGCRYADEVGSVATDCRDQANDGNIGLPSTPPPGNGPDWGDLFTGAMNGPDRVHVIATPKDDVEPDGADIQAGSNSVYDYLDYGAIAAVFIGDHISAGNAVDDTTMVSSGSDTNEDLPETYVWGTDSVPSKDDITNAYCYATENDVSELIIYCGVERLSNDGASHVDIELNKNEIGFDEAPPCDKSTCNLVGNRSDGDMMVSLDFTQGGDFGSLEIRVWDNTLETWGDPVVELEEEGCNGEITNGHTIPAGAACGYNNNDEINGGPWPNFIKDTVPIDAAPFTTGMLPRNAFSEFGVNVSQILEDAQCIATLQIKTRTSHSFSSQLKDIAVEDFPVCSSTIRTEIHDSADTGNPHTDIQDTTVKVGTVIHDWAEVEVTGPGITEDPEGMVSFYLYNNGTCDAGELAANVIGSDLDVPVDNFVGDDAKATAKSKNFGPLPAGTYSFHADFDSSSPNVPSSMLANEDCEVIDIAKYESKISTEIHNSAETEPAPDIKTTTEFVGLTIHDHAFVEEKTGTFGSSAPVPGGTVTFSFFNNLLCSGTAAGSSTVSLDSNGEATTADFTPLGETTLSYKASYSGDANYSGSTDPVCEPLQVDKYDSQIRTEIHESGGHTPDLQSDTVPVYVGLTIHDHAYVSVKGTHPTAPTPGGSVNFKRFSTIDCTGGSTDSSVALSSGEAITADFTPAGDTVLSFSVSYSGDTNYNAATDTVCEPLDVDKYDSKLKTEIHQGTGHSPDKQGEDVNIGPTYHDHAYWAETTGAASAPAPTGNVTFNIYLNATCSGDAQSSFGGISWPQSDGLNTTSVVLWPYDAETSQFTPPAGAFSIRASWAEDANYHGSTAACEEMEVLKLDPNISTTVKVRDLAQVSGSGPPPSGVVTFKTFYNNTCSGDPEKSVPVTLGSGAAELEVDELLGPAADVVSYKASYGGDTNYNPVAHDCEVVTFSIYVPPSSP